MRRLGIEIIHTPSCPAWQAVSQRLEALARDEGIAVAITETSVSDVKEATARQLRGSPTILIEGLDVDPPPEGAPADYGLG